MVCSNRINLFERLKDGIATLDLACKAKNFFEKIVWVAIGVLGTMWAFYFIGKEIMHWSTNPTLITQGKMDLSEVEYPAITICPPGSTKYAIAERLGNYLDPSFIEREKFLSLANKYLFAFLNFNLKWNSKRQYDNLCGAEWKEGCKVIASFRQKHISSSWFSLFKD